MYLYMCLSQYGMILAYDLSEFVGGQWICETRLGKFHPALHGRESHIKVAEKYEATKDRKKTLLMAFILAGSEMRT